MTLTPSSEQAVDIDQQRQEPKSRVQQRFVTIEIDKQRRQESFMRKPQLTCFTKFVVFGFIEHRFEF